MSSPRGSCCCLSVWKRSSAVAIHALCLRGRQCAILGEVDTPARLGGDIVERTQQLPQLFFLSSPHGIIQRQRVAIHQATEQRIGGAVLLQHDETRVSPARCERSSISRKAALAASAGIML